MGQDLRILRQRVGLRACQPAEALHRRPDRLEALARQSQSSEKIIPDNVRNYFSLNSRSAFARPIFRRSSSLIGHASNQIAAWSTFSNGQSVENMMRSEPTSSMASISVCVRKLPEVVR